MLDINFLKWNFLLMTFFIVVIGSFINFFESSLPWFVSRFFRYGKFAYTSHNSRLIVEVPKRWFKHFYVFASSFSLYSLYLAIDLYFYHHKPDHFISYLDLVAGSNRKTSVAPLAALIATFLLSLQCMRRFYDTWFVSVFSKGKMNLSHYFVGFFHYWGTITVILSEAQGFSHRDTILRVHISQLTIPQYLGILMFLWAWINQFECFIILAKLRKNNEGQIVTEAHKIPRGGLFLNLSSPHLTCEALMYLALMMILRNSETFPYVFAWVFVNQLETALLNHWWYRSTFKDYPKRRKAFVPYVL